MATSVHIPKTLLAAVDERARSLRVSRNKLIIQALEREVTAGADWPPGFFEQLGKANAELSDAVKEMAKAIESRRKSKRPLKL